MSDKLLIPDSDIWRVRGIGVAERVRTSILFLYDLIFSLCLTPKRCSSSIISNPNLLHSISSLNILCVPISKSTLPSFKSSSILVCLLFGTNLFISSILIGNSLNLSIAFW